MSLPAPTRDWALFLDFDGTLAVIAAHPEAVEVDVRLPRILEALADALHGAVAVISGRPLSQVDWFIAPATLPGAGLHGLERRDADGRTHGPDAQAHALDPIRAQLGAFAAARPGVRLEDKTYSLALHYRAAPAFEVDCRRAVEESVAGHHSVFHVLAGKMVFEVKPRAADKGRAIEAFLAEPPFVGRRPVFVGDDVTDEDGFTVVNARGGITIRVGDDKATHARWRAADVAELLDWLAAAPGAIATRSAREGEANDDQS